VGSGTVLADDPRLDRRLGLAGAPGLRVVMDRRLRVRPGAALFTVPGPVLIYTEPAAAQGRSAWLAQAGEQADIAVLPAVEPASVLADLWQRGVRSVLAEGGSEVHASFVASGCFDRVAVDCAPLLIGGRGAPGPLGGTGFEALAAAARLDGFEARTKGGDLILTGYRKGCLPALYKSVGV
jgi:diaminohydroxyphosphoribosylaminopyrimidine deaminase/5-amino-6-(5-phosphoribosylamino)uracil reductase